MLIEVLIAFIFLAILLYAVYVVFNLPMFASIPQGIKVLVYLLVFALVFAFILSKMGLMPSWVA